MRDLALAGHAAIGAHLACCFAFDVMVSVPSSSRRLSLSSDFGPISPLTFRRTGTILLRGPAPEHIATVYGFNAPNTF